MERAYPGEKTRGRSLRLQNQSRLGKLSGQAEGLGGCAVSAFSACRQLALPVAEFVRVMR